MDSPKIKLDKIDWHLATMNLNTKGYTLIPDLLSHDQCDNIIKNYTNPTAYRKTVVMEHHRFGLGEYKYFNYPLPSAIQTLRESLYPNLAPIANNWMKALKINTYFPDTLQKLHDLCHANKQEKATALILKYGKGGFNTLHQDLYGDVYFPMQTVLFLNEPGVDFTGGEFVLTQQNPRAQSKAIVLQPTKGSMLIFATAFRPVKGGKGYYRANMKHGVSELHSGERHTLGIIFHDALT